MLNFILEANDGTMITVEEDVAYQSNLIKKMVENLGLQDSESSILSEPLPITNIDGWALQKIFDWCTKHRGEVFQPKEEHEDPRITLTKEDEEYLDMSNDQLLSVLLVGFLNFQL